MHSTYQTTQNYIKNRKNIQRTFNPGFAEALKPVQSRRVAGYPPLGRAFACPGAVCAAPFAGVVGASFRTSEGVRGSPCLMVKGKRGSQPIWEMRTWSAVSNGRTVTVVFAQTWKTQVDVRKTQPICVCFFFCSSFFWGGSGDWETLRGHAK